MQIQPAITCSKLTKKALGFLLLTLVKYWLGLHTSYFILPKSFLMLIMDLNQNMPKSAYRKLSNLKLFCNVFALYLNETLNPFSTNVPFMGKPGSWFLLAKCFKRCRSSTGCLNVKKLLAWNRCNIWSLSYCNGIGIHNHLVRKRNSTILAKWLSVRLRTKWLRVRIPVQSFQKGFEATILKLEGVWDK